jgi:hypothetical protein
LGHSGIHGCYPDTTVHPRVRGGARGGASRATSANHGVGPGPAPSIGLLVGRLLVGCVMAAHGYQKLVDLGPANFGMSTLDPAGVPFRRRWATS